QCGQIHLLYNIFYPPFNKGQSDKQKAESKDQFTPLIPATFLINQHHHNPGYAGDRKCKVLYVETKSHRCDDPAINRSAQVSSQDHSQCILHLYYSGADKCKHHQVHDGTALQYAGNDGAPTNGLYFVGSLL